LGRQLRKIVHFKPFGEFRRGKFSKAVTPLSIFEPLKSIILRVHIIELRDAVPLAIHHVASIAAGLLLVFQTDSGCVVASIRKRATLAFWQVHDQRGGATIVWGPLSAFSDLPLCISLTPLDHVNSTTLQGLGISRPDYSVDTRLPTSMLWQTVGLSRSTIAAKLTQEPRKEGS
jgi:hypothetical protein